MLGKTPELFYKFYVTDALSKDLHNERISKCKTDFKVIAHSYMKTFFMFDDEIFVDMTVIKEVFDNEELLMQTLIHEFSEVSLALGVMMIHDNDFRSSVTHYATVHGLDEPNAFLALPF